MVVGYRITLVLLVFAVTAQAVPAAIPPESVDIRREYAEVFEAPLHEFLRASHATRESRLTRQDVRVTGESTPDHAYLLFIPESNGEFPVYSAGSYILRRRRSDGEIDQLKIFLQSDPGFFLRIWPGDGERAAMSVYLAGTEIHSHIPLPMSVSTIMRESLSHLLDVTGSRVDWSLFFPDYDPAQYSDVARMAERARNTLHTLPDAEDGAMDDQGRLVLIESLVLQDQQPGFNCSGFAKWIVDGLAMPLYGEFLSIEALKTKHLDLRGHRWSAPQEDDRDPYFGLDWTRNLATAMLSAERGESVHPEAADVRNVSYTEYTEDVGFPVDRLPQILYLLTLSEPGHFYIGSVNREFGSSPTLNQHVHVAVFFPYFDESGRFVVDVLERNAQTSLESIDRRYHSDNVHLVRVRADEAYSPPIIHH